jgi:hypothetical protein
MRKKKKGKRLKDYLMWEQTDEEAEEYEELENYI